MAGIKSVKKRAEAERAAEWYLVEGWGCILTRRALRTQYAAVDMFASDVMGKREDGSNVYAQVTAGGNSAMTARRRKLEAVPWNDRETVLLLQLKEGAKQGNRKSWYFRVQMLLPNNTWVEYAIAPVDREWFKAYKPLSEGLKENAVEQ